jgi:hypothetical protein
MHLRCPRPQRETKTKPLNRVQDIRVLGCSRPVLIRRGLEIDLRIKRMSNASISSHNRYMAKRRCGNWRSSWIQTCSMTTTSSMRSSASSPKMLLAAWIECSTATEALKECKLISSSSYKIPSIIQIKSELNKRVERATKERWLKQTCS